MSLPDNINDREQQKFGCNSDNLVYVRTSGEGTFRPAGLQNGGKITIQTVNSTTWTALPAAALTDRNAISIQNQSTTEIKINYDNTVVGYVGLIIPAGGERFYDITDSIFIYAKSALGTIDLAIEEIS